MIAADPTSLTGLLRRLDVIGAAEHALAADAAGEGNMNITLRVRTTAGSFIVKQSPPYVAKYPSIEAPQGRAEVEAAFYGAVAGEEAVASALPRLLAADPALHLLVLEDLGASRDCVDLYAGGQLTAPELDVLVAWLQALHAVPTGALPAVLMNRAMRALNHAHLFELPFAAISPIDLDAVLPGLAAVADPIRTDPAVRSRAQALGESYLADGGALLHGDYYPGSWLRTERGLAIIDAEFTFVGDPAFDWGVLIGHLVLARQAPSLVQRAVDAAPPGSTGFAGIEVLRRLLGVAQLPLQATLDERTTMLERARAWLVQA